MENYNHRALSKLSITILLLLTLGALYVCKDIRFNYNIESYFDESSPEAKTYRKFSSNFERDIDFVLLGIVHHPSVFREGFLSKLPEIKSSLQSIEGVDQVRTPLDLKQLIKTPMGFSEIPVLHTSGSKAKKDSAKIYNSGQFVGSFFSMNGEALNITIKLDSNINKVKGDSILDAMHAVLSPYEFEDYRVAGRISTQRFYVKQMGMELIIFSGVAAILLVIFLWAIYRSIWPIWMSMVVIGISILFTSAVIVLSIGELNMLMTMLPILLFVIGISDVIHIITKYIEELRCGQEKNKALIITLREVGLATFLTSLTTAIGFLSLLSSKSPPIRDFGIFIATGVMLTYVVSITLLPAFLFLYKKPKIGTYKPMPNLFWNRNLHTGFRKLFRNYGKVVLATVIILAASLYGANNMSVNNYFLDDLNDKSSLKQDLNFFEHYFSGVRPFEVQLTLKDTSKSVLDFEVVQDMNILEDYILKTYDVSTATSFLTLVRSANRALHSGDNKFYKIPDNEKDYKRIIYQLKKYGILKKNLGLISADKKMGRISGKSKDLGSRIFRKKDAKLRAYQQENDLQLIAQVTGIATLLDKTNSSITVKLIKGLGLAIAVIASIIGILFRSFRIVLISLVPNLIPLIVIAGIIGIFHLDIKISTGIVFTIAFGIAVDDTIHFLSKLKIELAKGKSLLYAIKRTFLSTGKAIILTSIVLSSGFISLSLSQFESTILIGILICITLLIAVLADLFLLPLLLLKFFKNNTKK